MKDKLKQRIKNRPGPADEAVAAVGALLPVIIFVGVVAVVFAALHTGTVEVNYSITGEIPAEVILSKVIVPFVKPMAYVISGSFALLFILSVSYWFGFGRVMALFRFADDIVADYQGQRNRD